MILKKLTCYLILLFVGVPSGLSQNLVPNGSFEQYKDCPGSYSRIREGFDVDHWVSATTGTPDHFHTCSNGEADVPHNWAGVSDAYEGQGYAGIYMWMEIGNGYREYLQCQLSEPLVKDSTYRIAFRYKLSSYSKYCIDRIGLLLTDTRISVRHDKVLRFKPTLSVIQDSAITENTGLWEAATMKYKAVGGEQFLTIGNFFDDDATGHYSILTRPFVDEMVSRSSYYYVDKVEVAPYYLPGLETLLPEFTLTEAQLNTTYVLKNILFEFNSYKLVSPSFQELDQVADYLMRHPKVIVQLFGHTDDQGSENYNLKLSRDRAKNAGAYLASVGINPKRIETFGYGKSRPLIQSTTEEARSVNRRVEVKFIQ